MKENNFAKEMREECERKKTAARRILEISTELRLTWADFEEVLGIVRRSAYLSNTSAGTIS